MIPKASQKQCSNPAPIPGESKIGMLPLNANKINRMCPASFEKLWLPSLKHCGHRPQWNRTRPPTSLFYFGREILQSHGIKVDLDVKACIFLRSTHPRWHPETSMKILIDWATRQSPTVFVQSGKYGGSKCGSDVTSSSRWHQGDVFVVVGTCVWSWIVRTLSTGFGDH